ncbi:OmpA family protein [Arsenicibacter rosenii]|uniref:OmpA-like domain-containing protein n=1 Tax=Arsenicibacter rosenii TaxID=1750698 RepID=A0A1S2VPK4_9BACT|nr:OmpA family protein [Arsenicibacter rosenii]OIN60320.1 hypothetical protein BLX24_05690 [Arsenicibacter rosenii]
MKFLPFALLCFLVALPVSGQRPSGNKPLRSSGDGLKGEYFNGNAFQEKVATRVDPVINFTFDGFVKPVPGLKIRPFTARWTGLLLAPATGPYRLTSVVDDGIRVTIGGMRVLDEWRYRRQKVTGRPFRMEAGKYYDILIEYVNQTGNGYADLDWDFREKAKYTATGFISTRSIIPGRFFFSEVAPDTPPPAKTAPVARTPVIAGREKPNAGPPKGKPAEPNAAQPELPPPAAPQMTLALGNTVILRKVTFEEGEYILKTSSFTELNQLATSLKQYPHIHVEIAGHTDFEGDPRLNQYLSENRAKVVANYLARKGINEEQMTVKGYGSKRPLIKSGTEAERAANRRVEITVTAM